MTIEIDQKSKRVIVKLLNSGKTVPSNMRKGLFFVGKKLKSTASKNILKKKNGRTYKYKKRRRKASQPGESWANRSGTARKGIVYKVASSSKLRFGNTVDYAEFLEFGTRKMEARPAHLIAIEENEQNIVEILESHIDSSFK
jgi:HK97 gp10 family phage protein